MKLMMRVFTGMHGKLFKLFGGKSLGGGSEDGSVLLLTHTGAKSGKVRNTPLQFVRDGEDVVLMASAAGSDQHPGWYHNLVANPDAQILINGEPRQVTAQVPGADRQTPLLAKFAATDDRFAKYQDKTERTIPVVALKPR
ncbi:MAG TPA: nitroreductase family deazaflavin-dependent oxidoreductase [Actinobacteria bacterium]|nr:nitroreductase family deazaflavin-dependent oxidoreductase [Actinomycetota bacterium]